MADTLTMRRDPIRRSGRICAPLLILLPLVYGLSGCGSTPAGDARQVCTPAVGMTVDQLTACGCFQAGGGGASALTLEDNRGTVDNVTILNYLCPRGAAGVFKVLVVNGVARTTSR